MYCPSCSSHIQGEFTAEINIHFRGQKHIDNPGMLVFPKVLVCLECGFSWFDTPKTELAILAMCSPKCYAAQKGDGRNIALGGSTAA